MLYCFFKKKKVKTYFNKKVSSFYWRLWKKVKWLNKNVFLYSNGINLFKKIKYYYNNDKKSYKKQ